MVCEQADQAPLRVPETQSGVMARRTRKNHGDMRQRLSAVMADYTMARSWT